MSGPPVILFLSNQGVDKNTFRANLSFYFLILIIATAGVFFAGGLLTREIVGLSFFLVPGMTPFSVEGERSDPFEQAYARANSLLEEDRLG